MNSEPITIQFRLTLSDFLHFNKWHLFKQTFGGPLVVGISCVSLFAFFSANFFPMKDIQIKFVDTTFLLALPVILLVVGPILSVWNFKRAEKSDPAAYALKYEFTTDGVLVYWRSSEIKEKWDMYRPVIETATHFFLFITTRQARIIPKNAFKGEDLEHFTAMLYLVMEQNKRVVLKS